MNIDFTVTLDIASALEDKVGEVSLTGLGADGDSEYSIAGVDVTDNGDGTYKVHVDVEHVSGKFAAKDDVYEEIVGEIDSLDDISVEVS